MCRNCVLTGDYSYERVSYKRVKGELRTRATTEKRENKRRPRGDEKGIRAS